MYDWGPRGRQIGTFIILAATGLGIYICYFLANPFLPALTWALALAVLLMPVHRRIESAMRSPAIAALLSTAFAVISIIVPALFVAQQLVREAANGASYMESALRASEWREAVAGYPTLAEVVTWLEQSFDPAGILGNLAAWLTAQSTSLLRGSVAHLISVVLTFYLLFYFLRDRAKGLAAIAALSPLDDAEAAQVAACFVDTVHATIFGTVVVATVQGTLGGLMFWWLGLPSALFWGVMMGLLAVIPVLGAYIIWLPAAVFLALEGSWIKALILTAWGGGLVATIDNLLYPVLVGNRLRLHTVPAFVGAVGGIIIFGLPGIILGPVAITVTLTLLEILKQRFSSDAP